MKQKIVKPAILLQKIGTPAILLQKIVMPAILLQTITMPTIFVTLRYHLIMPSHIFYLRSHTS